MSSSALRPFHRDSAGVTVPSPGDPNPRRFRIIGTKSAGAYTLAMIQYPGAKNFEGCKIAIYEASAKELRNATCLDPHFQERRGALVPLARFEGTHLGWLMGKVMLGALADGIDDE